MTSDDEVRTQLSRLARGVPPSTVDRERVVGRASAALRDVEAAAKFADGGGRQRLAAAIAAAERTGDSELAARGRDVAAALDRFAAVCEAPADPTEEAASSPNTQREVAEDPRR